MSASLNKKIEQLKDEHAVEKHGELVTYHDERAKGDAMFLLGRMKQNDQIAVAISTNLTAQTVRALERFFEEKRFKALGFDTLVDFLDNSEYSPMSKRQYYDRLALVREHGDEIYDLLTSVGISVRAQKMLGDGELSIKNDTLYIGEQEVALGNTGVIKDVLGALFDEKRAAMAREAAKDAKIEKLSDQVKRGTAEFEELQRNFDNLRTGDPHDEGLSHAIYSLMELSRLVGQLSDERKAAAGRDAVATLWSAILRVREAYGVSFNFTEAPGPQADDLVGRVLAEDDDFGDEEEA